MGSPLIIRLFVTIYVILCLALSWILAWILQVLLMIVTYPFKSRAWQQDQCGYIFRYVNFISTDVVNPFWKVNILRPMPEVRSRKLLVMMNHLSSADPFIMIRAILPHDASWVAKDDLFRVPFGGWCLHNADDLKVCFKDKRAGFETVKGTVGVMMEVARAKLRRGRRLAIFPEGIRNRNPAGGLLPFRLGFFTLAVEEDATIVPVAISGTENCWPRGSPLMDRADVYVSCGDPIEAGQFETAEQLRDRVWAAITELREKHPDIKGLQAKKED
ncbi:1-acyl-sn-glycerol-3-phosphate acyltransferase [Trypanosoma theileri]|uniref:1-acyl-sn-glycerol-3-phosphate acyltransferase n=1 Tax=Trypanosoma theileri TaxID=67003 RepID=A0A1X0NUQ7_9TRYP|nr:1-acyl-sn-glycerol-3-phosphate acyltransferase [Trypanosoma theileri]ORC88278.1 1-acyl-sn-glycerol-3-phosphate acyltransferase [Trypanosoma theileri]